jgi:hypothetical protein
MAKKVAFLLLMLVANSCGIEAAAAADAPLLQREEMLVYNLNRGPKSARFYMIESLKALRKIERDLDRAQSQVEQVDSAFNRARGRSDDRTMEATVARLKAARETAQRLEQELEQAGDVLKADIQHTLIK